MPLEGQLAPGPAQIKALLGHGDDLLDLRRVAFARSNAVPTRSPARPGSRRSPSFSEPGTAAPASPRRSAARRWRANDERAVKFPHPHHFSAWKSTPWRVVVLRPEPRLAALVLAPVRAILVFRHLGFRFRTGRAREGFRARRRLLALVLVVVFNRFRRYWRTGHTGRLRLLRRFGRCRRVPPDSTSGQFLKIVPVHGRLALAAGPSLVAVVEERRAGVVLAQTLGLSFGSNSWAQPKFWHFTLPSAHFLLASASSAFLFSSSMIF